jgi:hypothetical protein
MPSLEFCRLPIADSRLQPSKIRPAGKGREMPGYGCEYNNEGNSEPDSHRFKTLLIGSLSFSLYGTDRDQHNSDHHHGDMLHAKEPDLPFVHRLFEISQKILYDRTNAIQADAQQQLNMRYGNRGHLQGIIGSCKWFLITPAFVSFVNSHNQTY